MQGMMKAGLKGLTILMVMHLLRLFMDHGISGPLAEIWRWTRSLPGVNHLIAWVLAREARQAVRLLTSPSSSSASASPSASSHKVLHIPLQSTPKERVLDLLKEMKEPEKNIEEGTIFALVYTPNDPAHAEVMEAAYKAFTESTGLALDHDEFLQQVYALFMHGNALNPTAFPSLLRMENEVVQMTASMLHGDEHVAGSLTSGGTESILMAMKAYRDRARALSPHITNPEVVAPITIHPAFEKAAHYFGLTMVHVPIGEDFLPNIKLYRKAINHNTILLVASAPQYCHGVVDPIEEISAIAQEKGLPFHVDSCFGGFMLPWIEKLGHKVPIFDFRLQGVTSISADLHKYGFVNKGSSVVVYRNSDFRKYQYFAYSQWPGGLFGSPSMAGTRPGGNIAMSWAALIYLGQEGYLKIASELMETTIFLKNGISSIAGLKILGNPPMTCFAFTSNDPKIEILAVADQMEEKGWKMERQQNPSCIHCTIMPHHTRSRDRFLQDLQLATETVRKNQQLAKKGSASMYGQLAMIPDKGLIDDFIVGFFSEVYRTK